MPGIVGYAVATGSLVVTPVILTDGNAGSAYSASFTTTGGSGIYTYAVSYGTLPAGLSLNASTGVLSGTPSSAGTYIFTIIATDSNGLKGSQEYSVVVNPALTLTLGALPNAESGSYYSNKVTVTNSQSYTFNYSLLCGALPPGLSLNQSTGVLSGTPTTPGTYTFAIVVVDWYWIMFADQTFTITVLNDGHGLGIGDVNHFPVRRAEWLCWGCGHACHPRRVTLCKFLFLLDEPAHSAHNPYLRVGGSERSSPWQSQLPFGLDFPVMGRVGDRRTVTSCRRVALFLESC